MNRPAHPARFRFSLSSKRARWALLAFIAALTAIVSVGAWSGSASASGQMIDFEGFSAGDVPTSLTIGSGISGDPLPGSAAVGLSASALPAAAGPQMIFDSNCDVGCSGGDNDLHVNLGNILIYSEDGDAGDPDDCAFCSPTFTLNFAGLGPHGVSPESIAAVDVESGGSVILHGSAGVLGSVPIPAIGNGAVVTVSLTPFSGVTSIQVNLIGSGAIDNLVFTPTPPPPPPPPPPSGRIRIEKSIVSADGGLANNPASPSLAGFEFELTNQSNVVVRTLTTDANGRAETLIGIPLGKYTITESDSQGLTDLTGSAAVTVLAGLITVDWVNQQPVSPAPAVDIELATNGFDADLPADAVEVELDSAVTWTMVVTNTGNTPLTNVTVTGPDAASDTALIIDGVSLDVGETATYERVGVADEGLVGKLAEVTSDEGVSDSDPSHYTASSEPDEVSPVAEVVFTVDIELATNGEDADLEAEAVIIPAGGAVEWTYVVTNTGPERLTDIVVVDDNGTPDDRADDFVVARGFDLEPGAVVSFQTDGGSPLSGLFGKGAVVDTAEGATDFDPSHYTSTAAPAAFPNAGTGGLADLSNDKSLALGAAAAAALASIALLSWRRRRTASDG